MDNSFEFTYIIREQIEESEEEFIYKSITPYCETIVEKRLSKKKLENILRKGMQPSISLNKVKQAREELQKCVDMLSDDTIADLNTKTGLGLALEKIDKLIAESEE